MSTLLRVDTLIESLHLQLDRGGMTYEEAVVTEDIVSLLDEAKAKAVGEHHLEHPEQHANRLNDDDGTQAARMR